MCIRYDEFCLMNVEFGSFHSITFSMASLWPILNSLSGRAIFGILLKMLWLIMSMGCTLDGLDCKVIFWLIGVVLG